MHQTHQAQVWTGPSPGADNHTDNLEMVNHEPSGPACSCFFLSLYLHKQVTEEPHTPYLLLRLPVRRERKRERTVLEDALLWPCAVACVTASDSLFTLQEALVGRDARDSCRRSNPQTAWRSSVGRTNQDSYD
ncbi:hypothetical protein RRG08_032569 [Elysia crispata]|uniref:Uncharacterized protein n=1 Tax=Elysia crispata TaxID=231223 RepID=A0AAE1DNN6_9GAST|nr:hypothetical protein RRG08_032569 [Elysia crispata]